MTKFGYIILLALSAGPSSAQEELSLPTDAFKRKVVVSALDWLASHVKTGTLSIQGKERPISIIAWRDPTLESNTPNCLAGYAITDSLWASYALTLKHPDIARQLHNSLSELGCLSNSLHEVIWQRMDSIHHKPTDPDIVHGRSVGIMYIGNQSVDVRSFTMAADAEFAVGHPSLFAEHAVYQALYEFRTGKHELARERLRTIFDHSSNASKRSIRWNSQYGLLVDYVTEKDFDQLIAGDIKACRQYTFKLATLYYACRLLRLDREFPVELENIHRKIISAQLKSGGTAHYFDVETQNDTVHPCPDATGEATAIFILAETVVPK